MGAEKPGSTTNFQDALGRRGGPIYNACGQSVGHQPLDRGAIIVSFGLRREGLSDAGLTMIDHA